MIYKYGATVRNHLLMFWGCAIGALLASAPLLAVAALILFPLPVAYIVSAVKLVIKVNIAALAAVVASALLLNLRHRGGLFRTKELLFFLLEAVIGTRGCDGQLSNKGLGFYGKRVITLLSDLTLVSGLCLAFHVLFYFLIGAAALPFAVCFRAYYFIKVGLFLLGYFPRGSELSGPEWELPENYNLRALAGQLMLGEGQCRSFQAAYIVARLALGWGLPWQGERSFPDALQDGAIVVLNYALSLAFGFLHKVVGRALFAWGVSMEYAGLYRAHPGGWSLSTLKFSWGIFREGLEHASWEGYWLRIDPITHLRVYCIKGRTCFNAGQVPRSVESLVGRVLFTSYFDTRLGGSHGGMLVSLQDVGGVYYWMQFTRSKGHGLFRVT